MLTNVTLPYLLQMANKGLHQALREDPSLLPGVSTCLGQLTCGPVGEAQGLPVTPLEALLPRPWRSPADLLATASRV